MAGNSPRPLRRRQSIGTLQVADTTTVHRPVWSDSTPNQNGDTNQHPQHVTMTLDDSDTEDQHVPSQTNHSGDLGTTKEINLNKTVDNNGKINKSPKRKTSGVQFTQQMSVISNLSQVTLNLSCREKYISWRYVVAALLHFVFYTAIFMRNCMPIALVCMTDHSPNEDSSRSGDNSSFLADMSRNDSLIEYEFDWDLNTQSLILSGIQFSSCVGPLLCDMLRVRIGSKHTMTVCTLVAAALTFLSPLGARISPWALLTIRVLLGIFLGANVSTTADLLSWWAPASEKQTMTSFVFAGVNIGGMIASLAAGFLCSVPLDNGWPFIFYVFGFLAIISITAWHFLNANKPEEHHFISETECNFIRNYRTPVDTGPKGKPEKPPYKKIFTSVPVLSFLASSSSQVWSSSLYFTVLPNFFVTVHKFTVEEAGIIMSMISLARFLGIPIWTMVINRLRKRNVSNTRTKKIVLTAGYSTAALLQVAVLFLDYEYRWVVVALFLVLLGCQVCGMCVFTVLPMDMAPRYAGFLSGVFYSVGSLISISAPLMVAALAPNSTQEEWKVIWIIVSTVFLVAVVIFVTFGDATVQPWARVHRHSRPNIQSAFVSMGRRISAVLDGPIAPNSPAVRGSRDFSFTTSPSVVSMAPSGSENSLSNQEMPVSPNRHVDSNSNSNGHPQTGIPNIGFVQDDEPGMIDKVTVHTTEETERDELEERFSKECLDYIDDPVDPLEKNTQQPQTTRL